MNIPYKVAEILRRKIEDVDDVKSVRDALITKRDEALNTKFNAEMAVLLTHTIAHLHTLVVCLDLLAGETHGPSS